jgi:hypothetical protein
VGAGDGPADIALGYAITWLVAATTGAHTVLVGH